MRLKIIQFLHLSFCTAILLISGVVLFVNMETLKFDIGFKNPTPLDIMAPIMAAFGLLVGPFLFNKLIDNIDKTSTTELKLTRYQTAFIVKFAFLEAGALMNIIACLITSNVLFMIFAAIVFFAMWHAKPTKDKVYDALQLQDSDFM